MPSVLAIVSRKVFETDVRVGGRVAGLGDLWPTDRYLSKVAGLRPLEAGGSLYLCTVRPPDERLWLVAVLESPVFDGERWTSAPNRVAVTDVTALIPRLRFATGSGVTAEPGKLGMSLQTPRALTDADVALFRTLIGPETKEDTAPGETTESSGATGGSAPKPKAKTKASPDTKTKASEATPSGKRASADAATAKGAEPAPARRDGDHAALQRMLAPAVAEPLLAAWKRAGTAPAAASKQTKETAKALGLTGEALMVLDEGAEVLLGAEKTDHAAGLFAAARTLEKKLGKAAPARTPIATLELYARFAASGAVEARSLTTLATALTKGSGDVTLAFAKLTGTWAAAGGVLDKALVDAIEKLAKAHKFDAGLALAEMLQLALAAFEHQSDAEPDLWPRIQLALGVALGAEAKAIGAILDLWPTTRPGAAWRSLLDGVPAREALQNAPSERATAWFEAACAWRMPLDAEHLAWLDRWLGAIAKKISRPITLPSEPDPELVEICLSHGLSIDLTKLEIRTRGWPTRLWEKRPDSPHAALARVSAHPYFGPRLHASLATSLSTRAFEPKWTRLVGFPDIARELVAWIDALGREGTVAAWDLWLPAFTEAFSAATFAHVPGLREALKRAELGTALRNTMHHGILDELHWPLQEQVSRMMGRDVDEYDTDGPFPYWASWDSESHRIIVIGPEGVVFDGVFHPPEGTNGIRCMRWVPGARAGEGDVLIQYHPGSQTVSTWASNTTIVAPSSYLPTWSLAALPPGGGISEGGPAVMPGATDLTSWHHSLMDFLWDSKDFWRIERKERIVAFDPRTGKATGGPIPAFFADLPAGFELDLWGSSLMALPATITNSPLGQSGGLHGWRAWTDADGRQGGDHIDGRSFRGGIRSPHTDRETAYGLFRFPERDADCPLVRSDSDIGLWTSDGRFPLVPPKHANWYRYWYGAPQWLPEAYWHYLVPVDPAASRALRDATLAQAEALLAAARGGATTDGAKSLAVSPGFSAMMSSHGREDPPERMPHVMTVMEASFDTKMPPRLMIGLAHIVTIAASLEDKMTALKQLADQAPELAATDGRPDAAFKAIGVLFDGGASFCADRFEDQVRAVDAAFRGPMGGGDDGVGVVHVPESALPWLKALAQTRSVAWRVLAPGTPSEAREQLAAALEVLGETRMVAEPELFRIFKATFAGLPARGMSHKAGQKVLTWNGGRNRYFVSLRHFDGIRNIYGFEVLEYASDGNFIDPPDCTEIAWQTPLAGRTVSTAGARRVVQLLKDRGPFGHDAGAARAVSAKTGLLHAGASLLLAAAWRPWEATTEVRQMLGLKAAEAELGRDELNVSWHEAYQLAFPHDEPARLYELQSPGADGVSVADRLGDAVVALVGTRTPLPVEVVAKMQDELRGRRPYHMDVRVLENPDRWRFLTQDVDWVVRPWNGFKSNLSWMAGWIPPGWPKHAGMPDGEVSPSVDVAFSGWVLRHFLAYLAWAQVALPRGDALRLGATRIAGFIGERLKHPQLLLLAGAIDLSTEPDPARLASAFDAIRAQFDGSTYVASDGLASAPGLDRGDLVISWPADMKNSFFFAFRPAALQDPQALERLAAELGFGDAFRPRRSGCTCGLNFGAHKVVDFTDLASFVTWARPGFQRLVAALGADGQGFDANPNVSAPATVQKAMAEHGLTSDEATLLLQLRALPEPTMERVRQWNDWDRKRYDAAAKGLVSKEMAVEARHDRTKRTLFAPGPVVQLAAPAVPMEASKLELYGLEADRDGKARTPFGPVMPLVPVGELFEAVL